MKTPGKDRALAELAMLREEFRGRIRDDFEHRAKQCVSCEDFGACCTDEHFVNVHISELEAEAIVRALSRLTPVRRATVMERIRDAVESYGLDRDGDTSSKTYSCPLFEKGEGCIVHIEAKPLACINHACYERPEDLPPDELLEEAERKAARLGRRVYKREAVYLPLPLAVLRAAES